MAVAAAGTGNAEVIAPDDDDDDAAANAAVARELDELAVSDDISLTYVPAPRWDVPQILRFLPAVVAALPPVIATGGAAMTGPGGGGFIMDIGSPPPYGSTVSQFASLSNASSEALNASSSMDMPLSNFVRRGSGTVIIGGAAMVVVSIAAAAVMGPWLLSTLPSAEGMNVIIS